MKKLLLTTTSVIALGLASGAWAGNVATINQGGNGSNNQADVSQDGTASVSGGTTYSIVPDGSGVPTFTGGTTLHVPSGTVNTNGTASVTQDGDNGIAAVVQTDNGGANSTTINQDLDSDGALAISVQHNAGGATNSVNIQQIGAVHGATSAQLPAQAGDIGLPTTPLGADTVAAAAYQDGIGNTAGIGQSAVTGAASAIAQIGAGNYAANTQTGSNMVSGILQTDSNAYASVSQSNQNNQSYVYQYNGGSANPTYGNEATVVQNGNGAYSTILQYNTNNTASVLQNNLGDATSTIIQNGQNGNATVQQFAGNETSTIIQNTDGATASVIQAGFNVTATVNQ